MGRQGSAVLDRVLVLLASTTLDTKKPTERSGILKRSLDLVKAVDGADLASKSGEADARLG